MAGQQYPVKPAVAQPALLEHKALSPGFAVVVVGSDSFSEGEVETMSQHPKLACPGLGGQQCPASPRDAHSE
eukprot:scaffold4790_cov98-Cylindrotheca_fusiformis.AAC.6